MSALSQYPPYVPLTAISGMRIGMDRVTLAVIQVLKWSRLGFYSGFLFVKGKTRALDWNGA
jgi:hypothetical protein